MRARSASSAAESARIGRLLNGMCPPRGPRVLYVGIPVLEDLRSSDAQPAHLSRVRERGDVLRCGGFLPVNWATKLFALALITWCITWVIARAFFGEP